MDVRTGRVCWHEKGFGKGSLLIADDHLIVLGELGKLAWASATPQGYREGAAFRISHNKCWTAPILEGGLLYVRDENHLYCVDLRNKTTPSLTLAEHD